jgi:hypothetical protein
MAEDDAEDFVVLQVAAPNGLAAVGVEVPAPVAERPMVEAQDLLGSISVVVKRSPLCRLRPVICRYAVPGTVWDCPGAVPCPAAATCRRRRHHGQQENQGDGLAHQPLHVNAFVNGRSRRGSMLRFQWW